MTDSKPIVLRASNMDSLFACPPSVLATGPGVIRFSSAGEAAELGKACHSMCASLVKNGEYDLRVVEQNFGLDESVIEDASILMSYAVKSWGELERFVPDPITEAAVDGPTLTVGDKTYCISGTLDLCSPAGANKAIFFDWKSGYIDDGYNHQMTAYAYLLWNYMGRPSDIQITGVVVFLRHRYYRVLKYNASSLSEWEHDLTYNVLASPDSYSPGKNCRYCSLSPSCKARRAVAISTVTEIMGGGANPPDRPGWWDRATELIGQLTEDNKHDPIVAEVISDTIFRIRLLGQLVDNAKTTLRQAVESVGPIPLGGTTHLVVRDVEMNTLKPRVAMGMLRNLMSDGQIADCAKISLPKVLKAYSDQHQRGQKREARERLYEKLLEAGAIEVKVQKRLEEADLELNNEEQDDEGNPERPTGGGEAG